MPHRSRRLFLVSIASCLLSGIVAPGAVSAACWLPPVDAPVADPFRPPTCRWCAGNRGIEYVTVAGVPVRAVAAGRVTFAGAVVDRRYVVVEHADGRRATYGHLASVDVGVGERIDVRTIVGTAGDTVHFGLRDGDDYVDPTPELGRLAHTVRLVPVDGSPGAPPGPARPRCETPEIRPFPGANDLRRR